MTKLSRSIGRRCGRLTLVGAATLLAVSAAAAPSQSRTILSGSVPEGMRFARQTTRMSPTTQVNFAVTLPLRNQAALTSLLQRLYDPTDVAYGQYMTPEQFNAAFAPTQSDYNRVLSWARANGLTVTGTHANRTVLDVSGKLPAVETALHVRMMNYVDVSGRAFHGPSADPSIASDVAPLVAGFVGLDNYGVFRSFAHQMPAGGQSFFSTGGHQIGTGPNGGLAPKDIKTAYNLTSPPSASGQACGVFELDGYRSSDVSSYCSYFKLTNPSTTVYLIDGASGRAGSGAAEVTLDIELQIAIAQGMSHMYVYEGPNTNQGVVDTYNRIATDNLAKQVSTSWGLAESSNSASTRNSENSAFQQMAAQGQSIYAAAGDSGAYDNGSTLSVDDPASQPYMCGVGGTQLFVNSGETYNHETTWNLGSPSSGAGGGGISVIWAQPTWQNGFANSSNLGSSTARMVPDVSLNADQYTGYAIFVGRRWNIYGGTSCAAPLWAGFTALVNHNRAAASKANIGFLNPTVYNIAGGSGYAADFHDIADGSTNLYYPAVTGYDMATGLGTFNGANLLSDLTSRP